jgi:hypothetical protein
MLLSGCFVEPVLSAPMLLLNLFKALFGDLKLSAQRLVLVAYYFQRTPYRLESSSQRDSFNKAWLTTSNRCLMAGLEAVNGEANRGSSYCQRHSRCADYWTVALSAALAAANDD